VDASSQRKWHPLFMGVIFLIGAGSVAVGYMLASLANRQELNALQILRNEARLAVVENLVSSVDVYDLRISRLEEQLAKANGSLSAVEIILNDLRSDIRVLYDRQRVPVASPVRPADDKREQYYLPLGEKETPK
jgi:hypothetical protein